MIKKGELKLSNSSIVVLVIIVLALVILFSILKPIKKTDNDLKGQLATLGFDENCEPIPGFFSEDGIVFYSYLSPDIVKGTTEVTCMEPGANGCIMEIDLSPELVSLGAEFIQYPSGCQDYGDMLACFILDTENMDFNIPSGDIYLSANTAEIEFVVKLNGGDPSEIGVQPTEPAFCGNGVIEGDEQCDDGNINNADVCKNDCTRFYCGDGVCYAAVESCGRSYECSSDCCSSGLTCKDVSSGSPDYRTYRTCLL